MSSDNDKIEEIYEEVREIKNLLNTTLARVNQIHDLQEDIKIFESRQAYDEEKIAKTLKRKRFNSIFEWKGAIWEHCPNKKQVSSQDTVTFDCTLLKGPCMFENCPRNFIDDN